MKLTLMSRMAFLFLVTGVAFLAMGWIDPVGPLLMLVGAGCAAIELEARLDAEPAEPEPIVAPARVRDVA